MQDSIAVSVQNVSKRFRLFSSPKDRFWEALHPFNKKYHRDFFALKDISFEVPKGMILGIIGRNGSGKSTLLQIICSVLRPTSGTVVANGKMSALLELGAGFNPEFTGRDNVLLNGALMGFSRKEMEGRFPLIEGFADIGEFYDQPVKTYSSGMFVRLAFAAAINVDPDILIVDEALAVGDIRFQQKCFRKIREFGDNGKTIIFVSHDMGVVVNLCHRAMWLNDNTIYRSGDPQEITREYISYMAYDSVTMKSAIEKDNEAVARKKYKLVEEEMAWENLAGCSFFGEGGAEIRRVALYSRDSRGKVNILQGGEDVVFALDTEIKSDIYFPMIGLGLKDKYGNDILGMNTYVYKTQVQPLLKGERIIVEFSFKFPMLKNGHYIFFAAIAEGTQENHIQHHWVHDAYIIEVSNNDLRQQLGSYLIIDDVNIEITKSDIDA